MENKINRQNIFIEKCLELFKDENLDYSKVDYVNNRTKVCIIDKDLDENGNEYGEFYVTPSNFLNGRRHPKKKKSRISQSKRSNKNDIIKRFNEIHNGEGLDYSKVEYVNMHTKVCIIDPIYGEYWQEPIVHLKGCGHPKRKTNRNTLSNDKFIEKANKIHGSKYRYDKTDYVNYRTSICITCKKHGDFWQTAENHLYGKGCPKCGNHYSKFEDEIITTVISSDEVIKNDRTVLGGKELDIYIPTKKVAIEFDGLKWHSEWFAKKDRNYHLSKTIECEKQGIRLVHIFEDEYLNHKDIVISKLKHILGYNQNFEKIYARKCNIREISKDDAKQFLNKNHLQGYARSTLYFGCYYNDMLVGVMTFKEIVNGSNKWELNRFASDTNKICIGVGGKLLNFFIKKYNPLYIKSFADRRWSSTINDNLYTKIGFKFDSYVKPNYSYIKTEKTPHRYHKFGFRKKTLAKKYGLPITMTETDMVKHLGYDRIWDCGLIKYVWFKK